ncbi:CPBP family intramembrane metalloprotease [Paraflavitalea soli]|uniref:CPBP family intramembrane metalloprotease n=2 Tax=Paraflavitalea soli TaxID=2315862 RepID=A0A3B7MJQ3_9BACT|nr:CPBP family intramembrane metalloprotease [Paraflavitalea soli]
MRSGMRNKVQEISLKWYYTLGRVLCFYIGCIVIFAAISGLTKSLSGRIADHITMFLATLLTFLLILLFVRWEKLSLNDVGLIPGRKSASRFFTGYLIGLAMAITQAMIVLGFGHSQLIFITTITTGKIFSSLLLFFLVAAREELVFRSYALRSLSYVLKAGIALTIITIIFILEHVVAGMTWEMAIVGIGMGGVLFGLAALRTRGLALPLGLHSAWNFGQWSMGFKGEPGIWEAIIEKGYETRVQNVGMLAFVLVMLLAIAGILVFYKTKESQRKRASR